jgi:tetratricopeptide (TPR) repeat protein
MDMAYLLQKQATALAYLNRYEEALQVWNRAKEIYDSAITNGDSEPEWIQSFYMLGLVARKRLHGASDPETLKFALQAYDVASMFNMRFKSVMAQEVGNLFAFMVPDYTEQAKTFLEIADQTAMELYRKPNSTSAKVRRNLGVLEMSEGHFQEAARLFDQSAHLHYEVNPSSLGVFAGLYSSTRANMFAGNMDGVHNYLRQLHDFVDSNKDGVGLLITNTIEVVSNSSVDLIEVNSVIDKIQNSGQLTGSDRADALANLAVGLTRNGQPERGAQVAEMSFEFYRSRNDQCGIRELQFALAS